MNAPIFQGKKDRLTFSIFNSRLEMGTMAAIRVKEIIEGLQKTQNEIRIIFASAPSQNEFIDTLKTFESIQWEKVTAFHMDEYIGLPKDSTQSFSLYIKKRLLDKVSPNKFHALHSNESNLEMECERYARLLTERPIDLACLGVGENGHLAFNDPQVADFNDPKIVKRVTLDKECREQQVHDGCFKSIDDVPKTAITLTIPTLTNAKYVVCVVPSLTKQKAISKMINGPIITDLPASILRQHSCANLFLDKSSGAHLL